MMRGSARIVKKYRDFSRFFYLDFPEQFANFRGFNSYDDLEEYALA